MSFIYKNKLSQAHNWLLYHNNIKAVMKIACNIKGRVLDVGCGVQPFREMLLKSCSSIIGLEHPATLHGLEFVDAAGSAMMLPFKDESFDSLVSFQVMEHLPEPIEFLMEAYRVLKPGAYCIISTPFMWGEHEAPYDFYRYTRYGLKYLTEKSGFEVISIVPESKFPATHALRLNYYLLRFARGPLKPLIKLLLYPVFFIDQITALLLEKIPHNYTIDTAAFTTLLKKPAEGKRGINI